MKISIITVCFNAKNTIEETFLSIFNQSYKNMEFIVIDGNSTDGTVDIIKRYKDRISYFISEPDKGIYDAMNKGIALASGDYVLFLNANDVFYDDNILEKVAKTIEKNPGAKFLFGDTDYLNPDGSNSRLQKYDDVKNIFWFIYGNICHQSIFYHKSLFEDVGKYSDEFKIYADWDFNIKCLVKFKAKALYLPFTISKFLLGGVCSSEQTKKQCKIERNLIVRKHFGNLWILYCFNNFFKKFLNSPYKLIINNKITQNFLNKILLQSKYMLTLPNCENIPLISIITVVRNIIDSGREDFFKQSLESVHNQTYKNIEHIIIDGASSDGTVNLIKEYADKGWIRYISEPDKGIYDAMNKGAKIANGKYLTFMNSDDNYADLAGIEKCIYKLVKTNADFSYARTNIIDINKKKSYKNHLYLKPTLSRVFTDMPFSHQSMIVKSSVFKNLGGYDLQYKSASDYDFILKMIFNKCSYTSCKTILANFRIGGFSLENANSSYYEIADFYQKFYGNCYSLPIEEAKNIYLRKQMPLPIIKNILEYLNWQNKITFLLYQFDINKIFRRLRKTFISFKTSEID